MVIDLPTTTKAPPPSQKWVRGKQVGGGAYIPCEWKLALNSQIATQLNLLPTYHRALLSERLEQANTQRLFNHRRDCGPYSRSFKGDR